MTFLKLTYSSWKSMAGRRIACFLGPGTNFRGKLAVRFGECNPLYIYNYIYNYIYMYIFKKKKATVGCLPKFRHEKIPPVFLTKDLRFRCSKKKQPTVLDVFKTRTVNFMGFQQLPTSLNWFDCAGFLVAINGKVFVVLIQPFRIMK